MCPPTFTFEMGVSCCPVWPQILYITKNDLEFLIPLLSSAGIAWFMDYWGGSCCFVLARQVLHHWNQLHPQL